MPRIALAGRFCLELSLPTLSLLMLLLGRPALGQENAAGGGGAKPPNILLILCDDMGRVLQRKEGRAWRFPLAAVSDVDDSLAAVAERSLQTQMAIFDTIGESEPIDVVQRDDGLLFSYRFTGGSAPPA